MPIHDVIVAPVVTDVASAVPLAAVDIVASAAGVCDVYRGNHVGVVTSEYVAAYVHDVAAVNNVFAVAASISSHASPVR